MAMDAKSIEALIRAALPDAQVEIRDLAGDGDHYAASVISSAFRGKSRVERHRLINQVLSGEFAAGVHALAIKAAAPGE